MAASSLPCAMTFAFVGLRGANNAVVFSHHASGTVSSSPRPEVQRAVIRHDAPQRTFAAFASWTAPFWAAVAIGPRRQQRRNIRNRSSPRVVCYGGAAGNPTPSLEVSIWDVLDVKPGADKEALRKAYRDFIKTQHPDVKGESSDPLFSQKFQRIKELYEEVMEMDDEQLWLAAWDAGCNQVVTGKINPPSLNPWEERFRNRARAQGFYGMQYAKMVKDEKIDDGPASLFLSGTAESASETVSADDIHVRVLEPETSSSADDDTQAATSTKTKASYEQDQLYRPEPKNNNLFVGAFLFIGVAFGSEVIFLASSLHG